MLSTHPLGEYFTNAGLAPSRGLRWIDVGCGSGAFTELLVKRCAPTAVEAVDPSEAQLSFARGRPVGQIAKFRLADALAPEDTIVASNSSSYSCGEIVEGLDLKSPSRVLSAHTCKRR